MNQIDRAQLDQVSGNAPVRAATAAPITIPRKIDIETTVADSLDKQSKDEICAAVADSLDILNREPTSSQISSAKENEIEAARIRMEAYLAKKGGSKKPVISIAKSGEKAPAELTEASKDDSVLDPTALSTAGSSNCSSKNAVQGQVSSAKCDEIEAARIRMEA
ncbi:unnamed protein product [Caenorhabditis brenneri]